MVNKRYKNFDGTELLRTICAKCAGKGIQPCNSSRALSRLSFKVRIYYTRSYSC